MAYNDWEWWQITQQDADRLCEFLQHLIKEDEVYWAETTSNPRLHQTTKHRNACIIPKRIESGNGSDMTNDLSVKIVLIWILEGKRRDRPKIMWRWTMEEEVKTAGLT